MATCDVGDLVSLSNCFANLTQEQMALVRTALLCEILKHQNPMASCDPQELMNSASCFACLQMNQLAMIQTQLLCELLNAGGISECLICSPNTDPVHPPSCSCALYYRRDTGAMWFWDATLGQWVLMIGP